MSKLSKADAKAHQMAVDLLALSRELTYSERWDVVDNWQESATHVNSTAGAFFTPPALACDFAIDVQGPRIIDLCAGIGMLSFAHWSRGRYGPPCSYVCVERNPDYVAVGRRVLPEATWICADVFDVPKIRLGRFDAAISNPPFGSTPRAGRRSPRFTGQEFEYHVIDIASDLADYGTFIIPQQSAPFRYSGRPCYEQAESDRYLAFQKATGVTLTVGCGVDCEYHRDGWHGVSPAVEIVCAEFARRGRVRLDLAGLVRAGQLVDKARALQERLGRAA
jgi:hypothetical protein